jgi:hypothetical protein
VPFGHWQAVEEPLQLRFHIAHRLNVRPGKTPVPTGNARAGEKDLRFANSSAAALPDGLFEQIQNYAENVRIFSESLRNSF